MSALVGLGVVGAISLALIAYGLLDVAHAIRQKGLDLARLKSELAGIRSALERRKP